MPIPRRPNNDTTKKFKLQGKYSNYIGSDSGEKT
jgi:hypothetical protein